MKSLNFQTGKVAIKIMNLLKKKFALLLAVILCLSLAACGSNAPETLGNIVLDDSIDESLEDTYDEYLGYWYIADNDNSYICVFENDRIYFYELYDAKNDLISSGRLQYVKGYSCMYAYSEQDGIAHKCRIDRKLFGSEDDYTLYIDSFGTFSRMNNYFEIIGDDWRTWGIIRDGGTITIDGEDFYLLVCVHKADATFYYDSEDQVLFNSVEYPITFGDNVWEIFRGIDFSDLNGDGNGDVTMKFDDGGTEIKIVWFWDSESEQFVYQPDNSNIPA